MSAATARVAPAESIGESVETALVADVDLVLDGEFEFEPESEEPKPSPEPANPVDLAAAHLVERALDATPGLLDQAVTPGSVVILSAPTGWQKSVLIVWRMRVFGEDRKRAEKAEARRHWMHDSERAETEKHPLSLFADDDEKRWRASIDGEIRRALQIRRGILIACRDPEAEVEILLRAAADLTVAIPALSPADLTMIAESVGTGEAPVLPAGVAAAVEPDDLRCSLRPGQTAVDYLERVARLVAVRQPVAKVGSKPQWTLDTLPLPPAVEAWGRQLGSDLRAYANGKLAWSEVDRGALLFGPPGTGKTTFAQALAATCGVLLVVGSYSIWESGEDGRGRYTETISRMRQAFRQAKEQAPSILFVDEIDSFIARGEAAHNESWWTPMTNALLAEMDGISSREGVVVIAATNHPARIDPALRRAGRLDRMLELELPAPPTVARILSAHLDGVEVADLLPIALSLGRTSGADCERLARGARRRARSAGRSVTAADVAAEVEMERGQLPPRSPAVARRTAYHEAGHAVVSLLVAPGSVTEVSIRRAGMNGVIAGGRTTWTMDSFRGQDSPEEIDHLLQRLMAGRAAEELVMGTPTAGAGGPVGSDLATATLLAASAELAWGLGGRLSWLGDPEPETLSNMLLVRPDVAARVEQRLTAALEVARDMLGEHRVELDALAEALVVGETLTGAEAEAVIAAAATRSSPRPRVRLRPEVLAMVDVEMMGGIQ